MGVREWGRLCGQGARGYQLGPRPRRPTGSTKLWAVPIVAMASIGPDGPTGGFFDRHGVVPW